MPEPDFEQIARDVADVGATRQDVEDIVDALRNVWNARGAADREKMKAALLGEGCTPDGPYITMLDSGLRRLDR